MNRRKQLPHIAPAWWAVALILVIAAFVYVCSALFAGSFKSYLSVTLTSDRAGLVMETGGKVKMRGVEVGKVAAIQGQPVTLHLQIYPDQVRYIPANVQAEIRATTVFGAKFVDLIYPDDPVPQRLSAGTVLRSRNVTSEANTVFQNLVDLLHQIDVTKLNATLTAIAEGVRGQGERIGQATTAANHVLLAVNPRMDTVQQDFRSFTGFSDAYGAAAQNILSIFKSAATTSSTITNHSRDLDALLLNTIGLAQAGTDLLAPNEDNLIKAVNILEPTTNLLLKYNPSLTCTLVGGKWYLDHGGYRFGGGQNGATAILDSGMIVGGDPYRYPDNLPIIAAKGGPGGKPGCGSLPIVDNNWPMRYLVTNTGWGTGVDVRPNPGIGVPGYVNYLPVTRAVPEPPSIRNLGPPAPGPIPYPGAPPYGAPLYGPDGTPLYPGVPPAPPPGSGPAAPPPP